MLTTIRSNSGIILASCEWWLSNDLGQQDWKQGRWVWVEQLELSEGVHSVNIVKQLIQRIAKIALWANPQAIGAYWVRRDKTEPTKLHHFTKKQLLEGVRENAMAI